MIALPADGVDLERMVERFAQLWLRDPHAARRGRSGQAQQGVDVLAQDRRRGHGEVWAFQAKHVATFRPADLRAEIRKLEALPHPIDHFVVVTTARPSRSVQDLAIELAQGRGHAIAVWDWEHFSELFRRECGDGDWLALRERADQRAAWIDTVRRHARSRTALDPLPPPPGREVAVESVWVEPELQASGGIGPPLATAAWFHAPAGGKAAKLVPVVGPAGAGKTSLLWHVALERCEAAASDPEAPLPVVIGAEALAHGGASAIGAASSADAPGALWRDLGTDWIVFVDGLDQAATAQRARAMREVDALLASDRIHGVAVSCRDTHVTQGLFREVATLRVLPWSSSAAQAYRSRWAAASGGADPRDEVRRPVQALEGALAAAFGVPADDPGAPWLTRQHMLVAALVDWPQDRGGVGPADRRATLERLALAAVARSGHPVSRTDRLALGLADAEDWLVAESRRSGIFVVDPQGALAFTHPMVSEALAAAELARKPVWEIVAAAGRVPLASTAHLAAIGRVLRDPSALAGLLAAFAEARGGTIVALRRIRWLVRTIDDLGILGVDGIDTAADALVEATTTEVWPWARNQASAWLGDVAARGGPLWDATWARLAALFAHSTARGACLQGYADRARDDASLRSDVPFWMRFLAEEDAWVRAVAVAELARGPDFKGCEEVLLLALVDHADAPFAGAPSAVVAGWALRGRETERAELVPKLVDILRSGRQFPAGGAALALRPGEAPVEQLLRALRDLSAGRRSPSIAWAVAALVPLPGATEWLVRHWPGGQGPAEDAPPLSSPFVDVLPPSDRVRRQVISAAAAGFARGDRWASAPDSIRGDAAFLAGMARAARGRPRQADAVVVALVREATTRRRFPFLDPDAQLEVGSVAHRTPELVEVLVAWWDAQTLVPRSSFPGLALEAAATHGDVGARRVYAAWLPHAPFMLLLGGWWRPPTSDALAHAEIATAARAHAVDLWLYATEGRANADGKREFLAVEAVGHTLRGLWPTWQGTGIPEGLVVRALNDTEHDWFGSALEAFLPAGLPEPLAIELLRRISAWREQDGWRLPFYVHVAEATGLTPRAAGALVELVAAGDHPAMWPAAAALTADPDARLAASVRVAELFPKYFLQGELSDIQIGALVEAAPGHWVTAVEAASAHGYWAAAELSAVLPFLVDMARGADRQRVRAVLRHLCEGPQPWVPTRGMAVFRLIDAALELLNRLEEDEG